MSGGGLLSILQFAESAFPAGGYAHSFGLEGYCQAGLVADRGGVAAFVRAQLAGSAGPCDAVAMVATLRAAAEGRLEACRDLDEALEAMKVVKEFRQASRQMGRQTLRVAAALTGDGRLAEYLAGVEGGRAPGHHAIALGMTGGVLGWPAVDAARAFLYSTAALLVGAALRLVRMGQLDGQRVLWETGPLIERLAREAAAGRAEDMWSFTPGIDIQGMRHATFETRLFRS